MGSKHSQLFTGLIFYSAMAAIGFFTIVQGRTYGLAKGIHLPVRLESAEGLRVGAPVMVLGIPKGVVSSLHYVLARKDGSIIPWNEESQSKPDLASVGQSVICVLDLEEDIRLYPNYRVRTRYPSPISQKMVAIEPGRLDPTRPDWQPLKLSQTQLLEFTKRGQLPGNGQLLASSNSDDPIYLAAKVINDNRAALLRITTNLAEITGKMNTGRGTVAAVLNQDVVSKDANRVLAGLIILLNEARNGLEDARESRAMVDFIAALLPIVFGAAGL